MLFLSNWVSAQRNNKWELGLKLGGSNYHGDLAREIVPEETNISAGIFGQYNFNKYWSMRSGFQYGRISGSDQNFKEYELRNLSFRSNLFEFSTDFTFNFLPFGNYVVTQRNTPYVFLGAAVTYHNPKTYYNNKWYDLQPLRTEGQDKYSLIQFVVPFGGGYKHKIGRNWTIAYELGWRKTFTDYLDDVSQQYPDLEEHSNSFGSISSNLSDRSIEIAGEYLSNPGANRGDDNLNDYYFFGVVCITYRFTPVICWWK